MGYAPFTVAISPPLEAPNQLSSSALGRWGEDQVCKLLTESGFHIECRNFRTLGCELDILAVRNTEVRIVEVKTRRRICGGPTPIDHKKIERLYKAFWHYDFNGQQDPVVDLASVSGPTSWTIHYIPNVVWVL